MADRNIRYIIIIIIIIIEIYVIGHWRSFKLVPFQSLGAVSYSPSIVTNNHGSILHHLRDKARYWSKNRAVSYPLAFDARVRGSPSEYCHPVWYGTTRIVWLPDGEKTVMIFLAVSRTSNRCGLVEHHSASVFPGFTIRQLTRKIRGNVPTFVKDSPVSSPSIRQDND